MIVTSEIHGLKELEDSLSTFAPRLVKKSIRQAMTAAADPEVEAAKAKAPLLKKPHKGRYPGELRDSIIKTVTLTKTGVSARVGPERKKGGSKQDPGAWGLMVEFGSIHGPAQPYLRPAFETTKNVSVERFAAVLTAAVETMGKK